MTTTRIFPRARPPMKVYLETIVGENRRGRRTTKQRWVAESGPRMGESEEREFVGYGRTRRDAIANRFLRPYAMDFDSTEWKVRYSFPDGIPAEAVG